MGLSLRSLKNKIVDVFDANTQADQQRRIAAGQPRMYQDQQRVQPNALRQVGGFAEQSNRAFLGGLGRGVVRTGEWLIPGNQRAGADRINRLLFPEAQQGTFGQRVGSIQKGVVDTASLVLPSTATTRAVSVLPRVQRLGKAGKVVSEVAGGVPSSLTYSLQERGRGKEPDIAKELAIGAAIDAVTPVAIDVAARGIKGAIRGAESLGEAGSVQIPGGKGKKPNIDTDEGKVFYHGTSNKDIKTLADLRAGSGVGKSGRNRVYVTENPEIAKNFGDNVIEQRLYGKHLNVKDIGVEKTPGRAQDNTVAPEFADYKTTKLLTEREKRVFENQFVRGVPNNTIIEDTPGIHRYLASKGYTTITVPRTISDVSGLRTETIIIDKKAFQAPGGKPKAELKTRGFEKNITKTLAGDPTADEVAKAIPGYKPITNKATLRQAADEIIANPGSAHTDVVSKGQLKSAKDVAKGNLLLRQAIEAGNIEDAIALGKKLGIDGTKLGQAVQAYATLRKTTPEGVITFASKRAASANRELSPEVAQGLVARANAIVSMPEGLDKMKASRALLSEADAQGRTSIDVVKEILNAPRSAMATADLSAALRQGAVLGSRFPKQWKDAFGQQIKYFGSPDAFEQGMYEITQRPSYGLMKAHKLAVDGAERLGVEEAFQPSILESKIAKKLGVGHLVEASDRAYTGFLTKLRADVFDKVVRESEGAGVQLGEKELDSLTKFINSASGRGDGNITSQLSRLQVLFSPRLWKSRLDVLNPGYYAKLDGPARKLALQSAASFFGIATTVLGLAALSGADVESDPRSADFAKIKVGNTRYDIMGGLQQNMRLIAQLVTGEKINSETGELQTLGPDRGFGKPSRVDLLYQFIENKENPVIAYGTKALRGTDQAGEPINLATEGAKLGIPLVAQGAYDTVKDTGSLGKGLAANIPGIFGVGVQTYGRIPSKDADKPIVQDKSGKFVTKVGREYKKFDTQDKAQFARDKSEFEQSGEKKKAIGDTYFYKTKDGQVRTKPKVLYEWEQKDAKVNLEMDRAYESGDTSKWLGLAQQKYDGLEQKKSLYDPEVEQDEIDKLTLQQENLLQRAEKYQGKGITRSGSSRSSRSSGRRKKSGSTRKYAIPITTGGGAIRRPKVSVKAAKGTSTKSAAVSKPKVSIKKSMV